MDKPDIDFESLEYWLNMENAENQMEEEIQKFFSGNPNAAMMFLLGRMVGRLDVNKMLIKIIDNERIVVDEWSKLVEKARKGKKDE